MKVFITQNRSDLFKLYFVAVTCANCSKLYLDTHSCVFKGGIYRLGLSWKLGAMPKTFAWPGPPGRLGVTSLTPSTKQNKTYSCIFCMKTELNFFFGNYHYVHFSEHAQHTVSQLT